jgi:ubiquinone/menaquinone biosynthesis C-methylase UbiE
MKLNFKTKAELARWNDEMVKKYHSQGTVFESKNPILRYIEKKRIKKIIELAHLSRTDKIIDVGCGEGYMLSLLPPAKKVVGFDISKIALNKAQKLLFQKKDVQLIYGDARELPFADNSFDKILCSEMLEHVPEPQVVIKEFQRILNKDGIVVISVPNEKQIRKIMRILHKLGLGKRIHAARKNENYEWHIHEADLKFVESIIRGSFRISCVKRVPLLLRHRLIVVLKPFSPDDD